MNKTWIAAAIGALLLLNLLVGQQRPRQGTLDDRLAEIEARLGALEKSIASLGPDEADPVSVEAKVDRLEARVVRLEATPTAAGVSGGTNRLMESRIRSLERQVSRLRSR